MRPLRTELHTRADTAKTPTLGITGTGGAGKSSLTDELVRRFRLDQDDGLRLAIISVDPTRRKSGGALLGDRIRMNAIDHPNIYMRSLATRDAGSEISQALPDVIAACKVAGFDLIVVETSGIGQGDAAIVPLVDSTLYVMTPEFGAASQLEKIDMLDFADFVAINKFDRKGAQDALRDVAKQYQRNREQWTRRPDEMPVFGTQASRFNDDGVTALYQGMLPRLTELGLNVAPGRLPKVAARHSSSQIVIVPPGRVRYLADIADTVRGYKARARAQSGLAREIQQLRASQRMLRQAAPDKHRAVDALEEQAQAREARLDPAAGKQLAMWDDMQKAYGGDEYVVKIRDKEIRTELTRTSLSGTQDPQGVAAHLGGPRRAAEVAAARERAGLVPVHRRRVRVQARGRGPDPHVRRRRRSVPHQPALQAAVRRACRPSGCRPRSTRSRSTATTPTCAPTSTARSATPACRSPRSTT